MIPRCGFLVVIRSVGKVVFPGYFFSALAPFSYTSFVEGYE